MIRIQKVIVGGQDSPEWIIFRSGRFHKPELILSDMEMQRLLQQYIELRDCEIVHAAQEVRNENS